MRILLLLATFAGAALAQAPVPRDGQHDFDFEVGSWKIHLKRRLHPLARSNEWVEFDGTSSTRKIWDGRSQLEEFEVNSPSGHIEGLTLRLYDPHSHQWRLYWANAGAGVMAGLPNVGEFKNGRGEFYCQDTFNGRVILIRYIWSEITSNSAHFEQSFSDDGGQTWEVNWITDQTRVSEESGRVPAWNPSSRQELAGQRDFDPLLGSWKYHLKRRLHPLTGSNTWVEFDGAGVCYKVWNARAQLDTIEVDGPSGHIEGLTLRLFNPKSLQWNLYWANSKDGLLVAPQIGQFNHGHGEFFAQDSLNEKIIFVKFDWSRLASHAPHFEQSFSDDGGKSWEVNWITDQVKVSNATEAH